MDAPPMHIAMFPWFAMGHLTPFLHLSNKLAKRGHKISFFVPKKTQSKLEHLNLYPHLITFFPINVPHVDGLPSGAETTSDVPSSLGPLIMTAMDRTEKDIEALLIELKPQIVFFDFTYWLPNLTQRLEIKSFMYVIINPATLAYTTSPQRIQCGDKLTHVELMQPPLGYPDSSIKLHAHEAKDLVFMMNLEYGSGVNFFERIYSALNQSDAIGFKGCREIEGPYIDYLQEQFKKPILLSGPVIPEPSNAVLEEKWATWLGGFKESSVIYCALGSEANLSHDQFRELLLGLELTGLPFLAVLKAPIGFETIEAALPEGFKERVEGRGIIQSGWIQQPLVLEHPSVGCFVTHCGASSLTEALVNKCQIVLLPLRLAELVINARMMARRLKVGVEVEKDEDGLCTKENVCEAVKVVMDDENQVGREVRENHAKLRNLLSPTFELNCVDSFSQNLLGLLG